MPSVSGQDSRHPLAFDGSVSAICRHVEQNLISADGIPRTETLNSPQRDLLRLKWKSNNVRFLLEFRAQLLLLLSCKILQIQFAQSCEIELVWQEKCRLHIFVETMLNWWKRHRGNKICYFVSWPWNFALSRKTFFFFYCLQDMCYKVWCRRFISVSDRDIET